MFKKAALALAVVGAASSSFAVEANSFFDDASLDLGFRTYYFYGDQKFKALGRDVGEVKSNALAQGFRADFKSGYFYDLVGLDVGVYTAFGLKTYDGEKDSWGLLGGGTANEDLIKYGATAKLKLGEFGVAKYGTRKLNSDLYSDSDSRLTPELTQAASIEVSYGDLDAYAHQVIRSNYRNTEELVDFKNKVYLAGASYVFNNALSLTTAYGQQKDRNRQYFGQVDYPFAVAEGTTVTVSANYQNVSAIGSAKEALDDDSAGLWSAKIALEAGPVLAELAYGKADEYELNGLNWSGGNGNGGSNLLTDNAYYVTLAAPDMSSYYAGVSYDLAEMMPGLSVDAGYMRGKNDVLVSQEFYTRVNYDVQNVENLWVGATFAKGDDDAGNGVLTTDWKHARLQLRYDFSAL